MKYRQAKKMLKACKRTKPDVKAGINEHDPKRINIVVDLAVKVIYPRKYRHGAVESAAARKVRANLPRLIMSGLLLGRTISATCRQIVRKYPPCG